MKAIVWEGGELGAKFHDEEIPADLLEKAKEAPSDSCSTRRSPSMTQGMEEYFDKGDVLGRDPQARHQDRRHLRRFPPRAVRHRVQEQGRAAVCSTPCLDYLPSPIDVAGIKVAAERG